MEDEEKRLMGKPLRIWHSIRPNHGEIFITYDLYAKLQ
jgi:hypothetical protein